MQRTQLAALPWENPRVIEQKLCGPHDRCGWVRKFFPIGVWISNHPPCKVAIEAILARSTANRFTYNINIISDVCDEIHSWKQVHKLSLRDTTDAKICMAYILGITHTTKSFRFSCVVTSWSGAGLFNLSCGAGNFEKVWMACRRNATKYTYEEWINIAIDTSIILAVCLHIKSNRKYTEINNKK